MPKLITQRKSARRKVPPCGRLITYVEPHSPFQKLVEARRRELDLSGRALAAELGVSQSTLWIWMHNENGYPHPKAFKAGHVIDLCRVLQIAESDLQQALDASRHLFTPKENPMPQKSRDALLTLIGVLEHDRRTNLSRAYVLNLAKNLYNGATGEKA